MDDNKKVSEKVDDHTHVPVEKLIADPPFPDSIKIELIAKCNYRCQFCALKRNLRDKGEIKKDFLYRILQEAKDIGVREIGMFLLGESFLSKTLSEHIDYAKNIVGIEYVFITTNGYFCDKKRMTSVLESGLDSIKFSVNAGKRGRYKEVHGVDGFDRVLENIKWLNRYKKENNIKIKTSVSSVYNEEYKDELESFGEFIIRYVDDFYFLPMYNQAGHCNPGGRIVGNPGRLDNMVDAIPCWSLFNAAKITWDGWLTACCFDHDEKFKIANLNEVDLLSAWHDEKFKKLRKKHLNNNIHVNDLCFKCLKG